MKPVLYLYPAGQGSRCIDSSPILNNLILTQNSSYEGGGIYCNNNAAPEFNNCRIYENFAFNGGALSSLGNSVPLFRNCLFYNNDVLSSGGIIEVSDSSPVFIHNTISGNNSSSGSTFLLNNGSSPQVRNSIIWSNEPDEIAILDSVSNFDIEYSIITGGWEGTGNLDIDPLFVSPVSGDFTCSNYSYSIGSGDPAFQTDYDIDGDPRPQPAGSDPDLGVFEHTAGTPVDGPIIVSEIYPSPGIVELDETDSLEFYIRAYDYNGAPLDYNWELDMQNVSSDSNFIFRTDLDSAGEYFLLLTVTDNYDFRSDERSQTGFTWNITVNNMIPPGIPEDVTVTIESDSVRICWDPVPDAAGYTIYSGSEPGGQFQIDTTGVFTGSCWAAPIPERKRFYRVVSYIH